MIKISPRPRVSPNDKSSAEHNITISLQPITN